MSMDLNIGLMRRIIFRSQVSRLFGMEPVALGKDME
jgi:hypothetical protein